MKKGKKGERRKDLRDKNCRGKRNRKKIGAGALIALGGSAAFTASNFVSSLQKSE
jgi:hypothetical protein